VVNNVSIVEMLIPGLKAMQRELEARHAWRELTASQHSLAMFDELEETVTDMRAGLQVMQRLSADMSTLARPGKEASIFDLREAVRLGVRMASSRLKNIAKPEVKLPDGEVLVHGRHHRLVQVLMNLLVNAAEAIEATERPNGQVGVTLEPTQEQAVLQVTDDGCGIPRDRLEKICEPFVTFSAHGTGIGLALVSTIVEEHHGELAFDSEEGRGTTVTVKLPLARSQSA
jgi:signal transduction histidine kinase